MFANRPVSATRGPPNIVRNTEVAFDFMEADVSGVPVTDDQIRELFTFFDKDRNGWLDKKEFATLYRNHFEHFGLVESEKQVTTIINRYGMMSDSKITYDEFAIIMLKLSQR